MGAWGAVIMSFFGALFAAMTLRLQLHDTGVKLALPFLVFLCISIVASRVIRKPGYDSSLTPRAERVIMWSTIGEGVGLFIAANVVENLHRPEMLLPAMALVVGLHFLPIAYAVPFRPFYVLGIALGAGAAAGFALNSTVGGMVSGFSAAVALWIASVLANVRDMQRKRTSQA